MKKVEALVAECDNLDELLRLEKALKEEKEAALCLLYTSPSPRDS